MDMKRNIIMLLMACMVACLGTEGAIAQEPSEAATPIEKLIVRYSDVMGARDFIAVGGKMAVARSLIRATPMAAIAADVDELAVLKMGNVPEGERKQFESDLHETLKGYRYHGQEQSKNGLVDVYLLMASENLVSELVIYNPETYSLNSLRGPFPMSELLEIDEGHQP